MAGRTDEDTGLGEVVLVRQITSDDCRCPAGTVVGGDAVVCAIERVRIDGRKNPDSIQAFCLGEHTVCPTWRAEKDRIAAHDKTELVDRKPPIDYHDKRARVDAMHERRERARELLTSNTDEGARYRARLRQITGDANPFLQREPTSPKERADFLKALAGLVDGR